MDASAQECWGGGGHPLRARCSVTCARLRSSSCTVALASQRLIAVARGEAVSRPRPSSGTKWAWTHLERGEKSNPAHRGGNSHGIGLEPTPTDAQ